jgi:hypothetical protein
VHVPDLHTRVDTLPHTVIIDRSSHADQVAPLVPFLQPGARGGQVIVAEVLVQFTDPVVGADDQAYVARACGSPMPDGLWQGWIEFLPAGPGRPVRSGRETTQPSRADAVYWATGLTQVYLEGALERALRPRGAHAEPHVPPPIFDGPADEEYEKVGAGPAPESILNPFSGYRKGEALLRKQLAALSPWHLVNIVRAYELSDLDPAALNLMSAPALIEIIVTSVRALTESPSAR